MGMIDEYIDRTAPRAAKSIYDLKLHEVLHWDSFGVIRVPGGWLYGELSSLVFVPFNDEFQAPDISVPVAAEDYQPPKVREAKRS